jgi:hypothetical protein
LEGMQVRRLESLRSVCAKHASAFYRTLITHPYGAPQ